MKSTSRKLTLAATIIMLSTTVAYGAVLPAMPPSINIQAGPLGQLSVGGILSVNGRAQSNTYPVSGPAGKNFSANVTDGLISVAKTSGFLWFYLEAGAYNFYGVGQPAMSTTAMMAATFGPLPLAYLQITPSKNFNIQIGKLPAITGITPLTGLISNSYDVQFGLDGWQQQTISRGIQANYTAGPFSASLAWTDGYYSKRFNWAVGQLSYSPTTSSTFTLQGGGNLSHTTYAGPLDNSDFYLLGYSYTGSRWSMFAYLQYQKLLSAKYFSNSSNGSMYGASVDGNYSFTKRFSLSARLDYMAYSDNPNIATPVDYFGTSGSTVLAGNGLGYGPGSRAISVTLTPMYQYKHWFIESDISYIDAYKYTTGDAFGEHGTQPGQFVAMINTGFFL